MFEVGHLLPTSSMVCMPGPTLSLVTVAMDGVSGVGEEKWCNICSFCRHLSSPDNCKNKTKNSWSESSVTKLYYYVSLCLKISGCFLDVYRSGSVCPYSLCGCTNQMDYRVAVAGRSVFFPHGWRCTSLGGQFWHLLELPDCQSEPVCKTAKYGKIE